jgi:hypothetical protein
MKFIQGDQYGAEALIVAYLCRAGNYRALFEYGIKPHTFVAMHIFAIHWAKQMGMPRQQFITRFLDCPIAGLKKQDGWKELADLIKKHKVYYYIGKKSVHSFNYEQSANSFIFVVLKESEGEIVLSLEEGKRIKEIYEELFPEIPEWKAETEATLRETRTLYNLFGFPRTFYGRFTPKFFREAISFVPQSTVGTLTNIAYVALQDFIEDAEIPWDALNNKHDSILMQVPDEPDQIHAGCLKLKELLEVEMISPKDFVKFQMKSEVYTGYNWGDWHPEKNPEGMKEFIV